MDWTLAETFVLRIGALAVALTAIVTALGLAGRFFIVRPLRRLIEERTETLNAESAARVARLEAEFRPNGGGSLRDVVTRVETKVDAMGYAFHSHEERATTMIRATHEALTRQGVKMPNPDDYGFPPGKHAA